MTRRSDIVIVDYPDPEYWTPENESHQTGRAFMRAIGEGEASRPAINTALRGIAKGAAILAVAILASAVVVTTPIWIYLLIVGAQ